MRPVNLWAVIVSSVGSTAFGFLWYMILFREPYIKGLARTKEQLAQGPNAMTATIYQFVGNLVMIYVLGWLMNNTGHETVGQGLKLALLVWLGFVACVIGPMYAFEAFPFYFFLITTGYTLVCMLMSGVVLGVWK